MKEFIGKKVIIRGDRSGVFFGTLADKEGHTAKSPQHLPGAGQGDPDSHRGEALRKQEETMSAREAR